MHLRQLTQVHEHDFYDVSYGFRPGKSAHQALEAVWKSTIEVNGGWMVEVDIRKFFDTLDHKQLQEFVSRRVRDGVLRCLIGKWFNQGCVNSTRGLDGRITVFGFYCFTTLKWASFCLVV